MKNPILWRTCAALFAVASFLSPAAAQQVVLESRADAPALVVLERVIERGNYLVISRDTVLGAEFDTSGDLIIWDARVRLEGSVDGAAVVLSRGTLVVRPGARIGGPVAEVGGLVLTSTLAEVDEVIALAADRWVNVRRDAETLHVSALGPPSVPRVGLGGLLGVRQVQYNRADGLSVGWGPQWRLAAREFGPVADGWVVARTARRPGGGVRLLLPLGSEVALSVGAERATRTNEWWIRGDVENSVGALVFGRDVRDYHESDEAWVRIGRESVVAGAVEGFAFAPHLAVRRSRDHALEPRSRRAIFGRSALDRPNRRILEDVVLSAEAGTLIGWQGASTRLQARALVEHGHLRDADVRFSTWLADGRWDMEALWGHTLRLRGHARGSLGGSAAPPQRWSFVGGQGTIPTLPLGAMHGDRVAFVETRYSVPVEFFELPFVGAPSLEALHATGTAWLSGTPMPDWHQGLGVGVAVSWLRARAWIDPSALRSRPTLLFEVAAP